MHGRKNRSAIGIDIGGTKIAAGIVADDGLKISRTMPTEPERGFSDTVQRIFNFLEELLKDAGVSKREIAGIGIGCAGPVYPRTGIINNPFTLPGWSNCNIVKPFEEKFGVKTILENDADMAALGEYYLGAGQGSASMLMLTFGTGIGGSVILDGKILRGANGEHPEIGHVFIGMDEGSCYCGIKGCFESIASGSGIENLGKQFGFKSAKEVFDAAKNGNQNALALLEKVKTAIFRAAWSYIHTFLPETIVIGGGIGVKQYNFYSREFKKAISTATQVPARKIRVSKAKLGDKAGVIGAGMAALKLTE